MRIIHTSDWHLGQNFYGKSRAREHRAFMDWLLEQIALHKVDALIIAGDVFDTGTPPSYARALYNQFIVQMQQSECQLIILGGNHDSVSTLSESKELLACLNARVIPGAFDNISEHVFELNNRQGEVGAIVCALPYLRPRDIVLSQAGQSAADKQQQLANAIAALYQDSFVVAQGIQAKQQAPVPIIATGHLTTVGASTSESVREIYIGSLDAFNANLFPAADYIALGHIHRPQKIAKTEHIRYSGSPIPLSFDELNGDKSVFLVEFDGTSPTVTGLIVPKFQPLAVIKGDLAHIETQINRLAAEAAADEAIEESGNQLNHNTWLSVEVSEQDYLSDLQTRIGELIDGKPIEVLQLKRARTARSAQIERIDNEILAELSVTEVFERRLAQEEWSTDPQLQTRGRIKAQFQQVLANVEESLIQGVEDKA
ncbi:exonuclease subunit SbcD [Shewanella sp. SR44-3]|uniref:exonuclease subunit SbcD n=1 Tax=Shewanella sp. SR44-3 TaxID=2760936 RepID=UPI0015FE78C3|nr:exonuclease subunit SbcD [Shewanella sp. SR44-3]MBB1270305.1 exonuclease subunit SbcD [Shewanella sp. SR44-3]